MSLREAHAAALEQFRYSMNLIGPGKAAMHFQDCDRALDGLAPSGRWVDLGCGAGFPGLVFADLFPEIELQLVDSRRKRCWFVQHVLDTARRPDVSVRCQRVETLESAHFDGVMSRAFAPPPAVFEHARRLLVPGGTLVLFLQDEADISGANGFEKVDVQPYTVSGKARRSERWTFHG